MRTILMHGFHALVYTMCVRGVKDTQVRVMPMRHISPPQCGFKLFTRPSAIRCFTALHIERWCECGMWMGLLWWQGI